MERLCCTVHGGCCLIATIRRADMGRKCRPFPLLQRGVYTACLVLFPPEGQKGSRSPRTMVLGTVACARSGTARRRSSASCVTSGKGRQPGKIGRGQRAAACAAASRVPRARTAKCPVTVGLAGPGPPKCGSARFRF